MSIPAYTFAPGDVVESLKANANWQQMALFLQKAGDSMTGTLGIQHVIPVSANLYDVGSATDYLRAAYTKALRLMDTTGGQYLALVSGEDLSGNKTLTVVVGDANRTLTFTADASVGGTNTGDQTTTIVTPSGNATSAVPTITLAEGNAAIDIAGTGSTVTLKGPALQTRVDEAIANPTGTNDYGPYATDGFIFVEFSYEGDAGAGVFSGEVRVDANNPPTTVRHGWYFSIASGLLMQGVTIPVLAGERVRVATTSAAGASQSISRVTFTPLQAV